MSVFGNVSESEPPESVSVASISFDGISVGSENMQEMNEAIRLSVLVMLSNPEQMAALPEDERRRVQTMAEQLFPGDPDAMLGPVEAALDDFDAIASDGTDESEAAEGTEVTNEENLARTMLMLHGELGSGMLTEMPGPVLFDLIRSIARLVAKDAGTNGELSQATELLNCSSSMNIVQRLQAWPACNQQLLTRAASSEFSQVFADAIHELTTRRARDERQFASVRGYTLGQCDICCSGADTLLWDRGCCQTSMCVFCLHQWLASRLTDISTELACPGCSVVLTVSETRHLLSEEAMSRREKLLARVRDPTRERDCPRCSCMAQRPVAERRSGIRRGKRAEREQGGIVVKCGQCDYLWCFDCHAPVHPGMTCRQHRSGAQQLESWAKKMENSTGLRKARRCPKCKVMIEKNEGCNHMTCTHCRHEFCYICKKRWHPRQVLVPYFGWSVFGDHSNRLSVFGCSQNFMPQRPALRRFIRGILFALRACGLVVVPAVAVAIVLPLALALLGIAIPLSPIIIPAVLIYMKYRKKTRDERRESA